MNPKLRAFLEANGLRKDATVAEAWKRYDELQADGVELPGVNPGERSAQGTAAGGGAGDDGTGERGSDTTTASQELPVDVQGEVSRALAADSQRRTDIEDRVRVAGLMEEDGGAFVRTMLNDPAFTVERASQAIFKKMKERTVPLGTGAYGSVDVGTESAEKFRAAVKDGLGLRSGLRIKKPAPGHREFRGRSLSGIARQCMEMAGENVRGLTRMQLVGRALAAGSTSDFPILLAGLVGSHLMQAYNEWPATFRPFVAVGDANDFKNIHALKMSEAPDLMDLNENGEYKTAAFSESGENYRVVTKGRIVSLTRQMIINDDLRAFTRIPRLFGSAAKRMEGDAVYSLITTNGVMSDGVALFHADHKNLGTAAALSSASLGAGRAMMRKQTGMKGANIDVTPAFLLTAVDDELDAEILLRSAALPDDNKSAGVHNPWAGKLTPIADPRLTGTAWYLLAHPDQAPIIEVAYLEGEEQPYVDEELDFNSDALKVKVRHDFGAGVVDHIGGYKNAGA